MAELILTDAERAAALWSDLDDAALGRLVKRKMSLIEGAAAQMDRVTTTAAAMLMCCAAAESSAATMTIRLDGVTQDGRQFGDWTVVATRS